MRIFFRRNHRRCSIKKAVLKNFAKFTGKQLKACNFIKKRLQHRCFPVNIAKFLRTPILKNICKPLLLIFLIPLGITASAKKVRCLTTHFLSMFLFIKQPLEVCCKKAETCNFIKKETPTQVFPCEFCEKL